MGADADADFSLGGLSEEQAAVYDRQLRVWGVEAQKRLGGSKFFVAGLTGLASEACKNVVLAGVGTVLLYDDGTPAAEAAPGNFLAGAGAADGAVSVASATAATLQEMNPFCKVEVVGPGQAAEGRFAGVDAGSLAGCDAVLVCGAPLSAERINDACREVGAAFFSADCRASSANFFADLGASFSYAPYKSGKETPAAAAAADALQQQQQQQQLETMTFVPLRRAMEATWSALGDGREGGVRRVNKLAAAHLLCAAFERGHGRRPSAGDVPALVQSIPTAEAANGVTPGWLPPAAVADYVRGAVRGGDDDDDDASGAASEVAREMPAVAAVVGGILGQELLRAVTGKGEPVRNAFFFTAANSQGTVENIGCPPRA